MERSLLPSAIFLIFTRNRPWKSEDHFCTLFFIEIERLGESGATHDSQSASRSGVEAWVARNLNGWDDSDAGLSEGWVRRPSGLARLHHSRLSTRSSYQLYSFSGDRRFCNDNHGSFVYDSPNLFCGPSSSVRTGLTGVRSEPGHRTHLTSLISKERLEKSERTPPVSCRPWVLAYSRDRPYKLSCLSAMSKNGRLRSFSSALGCYLARKSLWWPAMSVSNKKQEFEQRKRIKLLDDFWVCAYRFDFAPRRWPWARST